MRSPIPALASGDPDAAIVLGVTQAIGGVLRVQDSSQARELFRAGWRQADDLSHPRLSLESPSATVRVCRRSALRSDTPIRRALHRERRHQSRAAPPA